MHFEPLDGAIRPQLDVPIAVLVVDDELMIRLMLSEHLMELGYKVLEAANGDEAVDLIASGVQIDIVLSDVRMPGDRDGLGVLDFARAYRPELPVVLCLGTLAADVALGRGAADFVAKPFVPSQVEVILQKVLSVAVPADTSTPSSVLLVDSDVTVRVALTAYLRDCGHEVIEAADTDDAVVALTQADREIDSILCSVAAKGRLNGFELARWVRANRPELEVALAGSIEAAAGAAAEICDNSPKLKRPYEPESVVDYIKQLRAARDRHPGKRAPDA